MAAIEYERKRKKHRDRANGNPRKRRPLKHNDRRRFDAGDEGCPLSERIPGNFRGPRHRRKSLTLARAIGHTTFAHDAARVCDEQAVEMVQHFAANGVRQARRQRPPKHNRAVGVNGISRGPLPGSPRTPGDISLKVLSVAARISVPARSELA